MRWFSVLVWYTLSALTFVWPITLLLAVVTAAAVFGRWRRAPPFRAWTSVTLPFGVPILLLIVAAIFTDRGRELADVAVWGAIGLVLAIDAALLWRTQGERGIVSLAAAWHVYLTLCAGFIATMAIGGTWL